MQNVNEKNKKERRESNLFTLGEGFMKTMWSLLCVVYIIRILIGHTHDIWVKGFR